MPALNYGISLKASSGTSDLGQPASCNYYQLSLLPRVAYDLRFLSEKAQPRRASFRPCFFTRRGFFKSVFARSHNRLNVPKASLKGSVLAQKDIPALQRKKADDTAA